MPYLQTSRSAHVHRFFVDSADTSKPPICLCGKEKGERTNKFNARKKKLDGYTYDSTFESEYAAELRMRKLGKEIKDWERQYPVRIEIDGVHVLTTKVDFLIHHNDGSKELVETKGVETADYRIRKKLIELVWLKGRPEWRYTVVKMRSGRKRY